MAVYLFRIDTTLLLMGIILVLFPFPVTLIVAGEFSDKSPYLNQSVPVLYSLIHKVMKGLPDPVYRYSCSHLAPLVTA